jgi:hypothetical protein
VHSSCASSPIPASTAALQSCEGGPRARGSLPPNSVEVLRAGLFRARPPEPRCARCRGRSLRLLPREGKLPKMRQELRSRFGLFGCSSHDLRRSACRTIAMLRRAPHRRTPLPRSLRVPPSYRGRRPVLNAVARLLDVRASTRGYRGKVSSRRLTARTVFRTQGVCLSESANDD